MLEFLGVDGAGDGIGARLMHATEIASGASGSNVSRDEPRESAGLSLLPVIANESRNPS